MTRSSNPILSSWAVFLIALSLSIGWGIRGNFGHESGAMIAGALAAIAVAVVSRREDWHGRAHYFALFGGLGWGFGGSISYGHAIAYTGSGQFASSWYGFFCLFLIGALWAGLGAAGTALPAVTSRERLTRLFAPLCFVLGALLLKNVIEGPMARVLATAAAEGMDGVWNRHRSPLYWFDSDWFAAVMALAGVCAYDVWTRRFAKGVYLVAFAVAGAVVGAAIQWLLGTAGWLEPIAGFLVVPQGDLTAINPETGAAFSPDNLLTNWPQFFSDFPQHLGWGFGLVVGLAAYFFRYGKWQNDSGLFLYMAVGWLVAFVAMPVLGSIALESVGGFRLTPPRSDDWAGIVGVFVATLIWTRRNGLAPVAHAASIAFIIGGVGYAGAHFVRMMLSAPGHPFRTPGGTPAGWAHYQSANWHSVMEQLQGAGLGIAIVVAMAALWPRAAPQLDEPPCRRWTEVFAVAFVLFGMTYLNLFKCIETWTGGIDPAVPKSMKAPLIASIEFSALTWFNLVWWAAAAGGTAILALHLRRRVDLIPETGPGKGQAMFLALLWVMVVGNFGRAVTGFAEGRLITEWVIAMNAVIVSVLIAVLPVSSFHRSTFAPTSPTPRLWPLWFRGLAAAALIVMVYAVGTRLVYGGGTLNGPQYSHTRFGPEAAWRIHPMLKTRDHR